VLDQPGSKVGGAAEIEQRHGHGPPQRVNRSAQDFSLLEANRGVELRLMPEILQAW
jgi:hypothetical protein